MTSPDPTAAGRPETDVELAVVDHQRQTDAGTHLFWEECVICVAFAAGLAQGRAEGSAQIDLVARDIEDIRAAALDQGRTEALNVERLAEAIHIVENHAHDQSENLHHQPEGHHALGNHQLFKAEAVAIEYAALRGNPDD